MKWFILLAGISANATASVLVKYAMLTSGAATQGLASRGVVTSLPLWGGVVMYGLAFVLYAAALVRWPLHIAHPVLTAGAMATVALASVLIFREPLLRTQLWGLLLVMAGIVLLAWRPAA